MLHDSRWRTEQPAEWGSLVHMLVQFKLSTKRPVDGMQVAGTQEANAWTAPAARRTWSARAMASRPSSSPTRACSSATRCRSESASGEGERCKAD